MVYFGLNHVFVFFLLQKKLGFNLALAWTHTIEAAFTSIRRAQSQGTASLAIAELALCDCFRIHKGILSL